jgi:hypothetical protein
MAVEANQPAGFQALLEDNGNPIELPAGSTFAWSTDSDTDQIQPSDDTYTAKITVVDPPADRETLTVTATTTDPDGNQVSGDVTVDIVPGVTHTYTVSVSQLFAAPKRGRAA